MQPCIQAPAVNEFNSSLVQPIVALAHDISILKVSQLARGLQTTLDVDSLLLIFFNEACKALPIQSIEFLPAKEERVFSIGEMSDAHHLFQLKTSDETIGVFKLRLSKALSTQKYCAIKSLLAVLIYPLRNALCYRALMQIALTDGLTGAGNRIHMENVLRSEIEASYRYGDFVSVLMIDIDFFKQINDFYGHIVGDIALKSVANEIKRTLRSPDMLFRYGGEEFLVLLGKTDAEGAACTAERLRQVIEALKITHAQVCFSVTVSVGVASLQYGEMLQDLLLRADSALYQAKYAGRNRVVIAN